VLVFSSNMRRLAEGPAALAFLVVATHAAGAAAQENATIAVDCPAFDSESRAALEARARADLLVRNAAGTFVVVCREEQGRLTWHPLAGSPGTATVPLDADPRTSIERMLEGLGGLVTAAETPVSTETAPAGTEATLPAIAPPAPAAVPALAAPLRVEPPPGAPPETRETSRRGLRGVLLGAGMGGELWSRTGALGPRASVLVALPSRFEAGTAATVFFTLRSPDQVSGRITRVALHGAYAFDSGEYFRIGADVFVDLVHAAAPNAGSANDVAFGGLLRATAAIVQVPVRVEIGPTLSIHPAAVQAQIGPNPDGSNGAVAFRLQTFTAGLALDVLVGPL
jgi:hypothetical protein